MTVLNIVYERNGLLYMFLKSVNFVLDIYKWDT